MPDFGGGGKTSPRTTVRSLPVLPPRGPISSYSPETGASSPGLNNRFIRITPFLVRYSRYLEQPTLDRILNFFSEKLVQIGVLSHRIEGLERTVGPINLRDEVWRQLVK
jgi:hypothetical protein